MKRSRLNSRSSSPKKKIERELYQKLRKKYLREHHKCECGTKEKPCHKRSEDIHHKAGRGRYLNRQDTWMAVARSCHDRIHQNPKESYERGHLINAAALTSHEERNEI